MYIILQITYSFKNIKNILNYCRNFMNIGVIPDNLFVTYNFEIQSFLLDKFCKICRK